MILKIDLSPVALRSDSVAEVSILKTRACFAKTPPCPLSSTFKAAARRHTRTALLINMPHDGRLPLEQRRSVLEHDPLVSSYVDNKVWCTACHKSIAVSKSMELSNWNRHCKRRHGRTE